MQQTWRWFGPPDLACIGDVAQAGPRGTITALDGRTGNA